MSYDLTFWKDVKRSAGVRPPKPSQTYDRLMNGETLPHVAELPTQEVLDRLIELFPDFEPEGSMREIELREGNIEVSWGPQHVRIDLRGDTDEAAGQIVTLMNEFGCRVFDPQTGKRYPLNKPTPWNALTPAERQEIDREVQQSLEEFDLPGKLAALRAEREKNRAEREAVYARENPELLKWVKDLEAQQEESRRRRQAESEAWEATLRPIAADIERDCPNGRWRRLGLTPRTLAAVFHNMDRGVENAAGEVSEFGQLNWVSNEIDARFLLVCLGFLDAIPAASPWADWRANTRHTAALVEPYFCGPLRDGYKEWPDDEPRLTRERAREKLEWVRAYRTCLLCALLADDESSLSRVLAWPDTDLPVDDDLGDMTAMDNKYHIYLAMRLRGDPPAKFEPIAQAVRSGKRPRAALLVETAAALLAGDAAAFAEKLKQLVSNWRKTVKPDDVRVVSIEGSILWHVARRHRLALPEKLADLVLR